MQEIPRRASVPFGTNEGCSFHLMDFYVIRTFSESQHSSWMGAIFANENGESLREVKL